MSGVVGGPGGAGGGAVSRQAGALPPQDTRHPLHGDLFKLISTYIIAEQFVCFNSQISENSDFKIEMFL